MQSPRHTSLASSYLILNRFATGFVTQESYIVNCLLDSLTSSVVLAGGSLHSGVS